MKNVSSIFVCVNFLFTGLGCAQENAPKIETPETQNYEYETVVAGISIPWGMAFLSEDELLVTEKAGTLYHVKNGKKEVVNGLPEVYVRGQGGLMDVALHPDFKNNKTIYLTIGSSLGGGGGGNTALYSAVLEGLKLYDVRLLYKAESNTTKGQHWGSRIVFDDAGHLFFTVGDRGNRDVNPQNISRDGGKVYRLNLDGSVPSDNPFTQTEGAKAAIFSYGHRNPQGMTVHPETGAVWTHEHGPRGGDEINVIEAGKNYGWPKITYGINYSGTSITDKVAMEGMEQPLYYWIPSIAPSGMTFLTSDVYEDWKGSLFVGSLSFQYLERLVIENNEVVYREKILDGIGRVRDVREGPDGYLYVGVEGKGILRITPKL